MAAGEEGGSPERSMAAGEEDQGHEGGHER
jgi:hypothetical protein